MNQSDMQRILAALLQPSLLPKASLWLQSADQNDLKGLKLLSAIYKHKGAKKFRKGLVTTLSEASFQEAYHELNRKAMLSTYDSEFSQDRAHTALLTSARFEEFPCVKVLNPEAKRYVRNWISLKDSETCVQLVLSTLRAILAFVNYPRTVISEMKQTYTDPSAKLLAKSLVFHRQNRSSIAFLPQKDPPKPHPERPISQLSQSFALEDVKRRKKALYKGSGQVATWLISSQDHQTHYQEQFSTPFNKYTLPPLPDHHTSMSLARLIPNPDLHKT